MGVHFVSPGRGYVCRATGEPSMEPAFQKLMERA